MKIKSKIKVEGLVKIIDATTHEVLIDKKNKIHFENMSLALARSLGHDLDSVGRLTGPIEKMVFGNGGSTINGLEAVTYLTPNSSGSSAALYNQTYEKIVDDENVANLDPVNNKIEITHVTGKLFSDVIVTCTLDLGEPANQEPFDNADNASSNFVFDELGLKDYAGNLLTHIIFHPIQKSLNRIIKVIYTIRIQVT